MGHLLPVIECPTQLAAVRATNDCYGLAVDLARPAGLCVVVVEEPCTRKPYQLRPKRT